MRLKKGNPLVKEIVKALNSLGGWGSLEIFVQDNKVTQITKRAISKTNHQLKKPTVNGQEEESYSSQRKIGI